MEKVINFVEQNKKPKAMTPAQFNELQRQADVIEQNERRIKETSILLSIREIRKILFDTNKGLIYRSEKGITYNMNNKEGRDYLYEMPDQDFTYSVADNSSHLLIIKP